jgi:lipoprotein-anchoring transpeptidase ErfK/SrfK
MKTLLTALAATLLLVAPASAGSLLTSMKKPVEIASVDTKVGWLKVFGADNPAKADGQGRTAGTSKVARKLVVFTEKYPAGTIIVDNSERRLYHVMGDGLAMQYGVAVGRDGFRWTGVNKVSAKAEWPAWNPPEDMRAREAEKGHILPARMEGGKDNPLGARALYLGQTEFRIHGTNQPNSIGKFASSGCIRMANADVEHLYAQVRIGATVIVRD